MTARRLSAMIPAVLAACAAPEPASDTAPRTEPAILTAQVYIQAPYDSVWRYLTEAGRFAEWHSSPGRIFGAAPGDSVVWGTADRVLYRGRLERLERGTGLAHTFQFGFVEPLETSLVAWDVVARGPVVWVRVTHDCTAAPGTRDVITDVGWTKSLSRLKTLLETGTAMPWPDES